MNIPAEYRATQQGLKHFRQEQIRNRSQLIPAGRMSSDLYSQSAQVLHQSPYFRSRRADLLSKFRPANNDSWKVHQHAHDFAQLGIGLLRSLMWRGPALSEVEWYPRPGLPD